MGFCEMLKGLKILR